jgi:hypothetical protein
MIGLGKNLKRKKAEYLIEEQAPNHRLCRPQIIGFAGPRSSALQLVILRE